jgi:hypothetical protein
MKTTDRMQVCLETGVSLEVMSRWDNGKPIRESNRRAIEAAVSKLGDRLSTGRKHTAKEEDTAGA